MHIFLLTFFYTQMVFSQFSFHQENEPLSLDPAFLRGVSGRYLHHALFAGLYEFDNDKGLTPNLAKSCKFLKKTEILCEIKPNLKFSNGQNIESIHFVWAIKRLFLEQSKTIVTEQLLSIKNAKQVLQNKIPISQLGVGIISKTKFSIQLDRANNEFLYNFLHPALSPVPSEDYKFSRTQLISSGPYEIKAWKPGVSVTLKNNKNYHIQSARPEVIVRFIESHETAHMMYQSGKLNFLKLLSTNKINLYKNSKEFFFTPMLRFDYMGLSKQLKDYPKLRQALILSLNYEQFKKLLVSKERAGCFGLPVKFTETKLCYEFNLKKAIKLLKQEKQDYKKLKLKIFYSVLGGESIKVAMEWMQNQWKKNLGLNFEIISIERGMLRASIENRNPTVFRKGVEMLRPTCLSALEIFGKDHPENLVKHQKIEFEKQLKKLKQNPTAKSQCLETLKRLKGSYQIIPLGEMYFAMMAKPDYTGFKINRLNQLNLTHLKQK